MGGVGSGGARNRSGPAPDPTSKRSDARGLPDGFTRLPASGYDGKIPKWPLPTGSPRERAIWKRMWRFPQAAAWVHQEWRWLTIAHYVRWAVKSEASDASPSTMTQVLRLGDSIGLSPAGLRENEWVIVDDQGKQQEGPAEPAPRPSSPQRRLRAIDGA
ncbi:hypothetical protein CHAN_10350 [Corynebacterium hansenii]|nr:hypothetical protein CHAN_10350 [Corynebacterium hansenii]